MTTPVRTHGQLPRPRWTPVPTSASDIVKLAAQRDPAWRWWHTLSPYHQWVRWLKRNAPPGHSAALEYYHTWRLRLYAGLVLFAVTALPVSVAVLTQLV